MSKFLIFLFFFYMADSCRDPVPVPDKESCQTQWTKYPGNPVMSPGIAGEWDQEFIAPGSVIYHNGKYHMWYMGGIFGETTRIGHATSPDGINWLKDSENPVLEVGPEGAWDENSIQGAYVLFMDTIFHMWYTGHGGLIRTTNYRIGHATSRDGVSWIKDAGNPVLDMGPSGTWDDCWFAGGHVLFDGNEYHLWYSADGRASENIQCGHATSKDAYSWEKDPQNPVLRVETGEWDSPRVDLPSVIFDGTTYHMWYFGGHIFEYSNIGYASSEDGSNWTKYEKNPVMQYGSAGTWDRSSLMFCSVIDSAGPRYKMWYCGSKTSGTGSIGYARSDYCDVE